MKIVLIILGISSIILIGVFIISDNINKDTKFGKWWDKHICGTLEPNDPNF